MSDLKNTLMNAKLELLTKKQILEEDIQKYNIQGYITKKNIRGRETYYLQFKDKYYKMTSVYLSKEKLSLCEYAFNKKASLEAELKAVEDDLKLLKNVPEQSVNTSNDKWILDDAIGISARHKLFFHIKRDDSTGKYIIILYGKKKSYEIPMVYINEKYHDRISEYITSASCVVDEFADEMLKEKQTKNSNSDHECSEAQTKTGIKFSYKKTDLSYLISFYNKREKYTIEYEPYFVNEQKSALEISRMGFYVEEFIDNLRFKEEVANYHERKQTVRTKTKKS
ncbi:hypothetical protein [Butyrivibrio sp. JL13D10]|uniref:hypothetical protein n=1 Tax=Butyrivibrio sp. JL13D10 TaxID=3236815 RepID=UPI0038B5B3CF